MRGLLLLAHGARDPLWARPFEEVAQRVRDALPEARVVLAYLEFIAPDLVEAGMQLADDGCREIDVVPLFLGAGGHVRKDVPALIEQLEGVRPGVRATLRSAVGEDPRVIDAMARVAIEGALRSQREEATGDPAELTVPRR